MTGALGPIGWAVVVTVLAGLVLGGLTVAVARRSVLIATALGPAVAVGCVAAGVVTGVRTMSIEPTSTAALTWVLLASVPVALIAGCGTALHSWRREHRWAAEEADRAQQARLDASRKEMITWISHDLRTPLAGIRAMTEALQDGMAPDPDAYLERIHAEAGRTAAMVDDLLSLSSAHAGLSSPSARIDISDLVSDTLATAAVSAATSGVEVTGSAQPGLVTEGDVALLSRALWNLVANAITHTPSGGRVTVTAAGEGGRVLIAVADGCGGIAEDDLPYVFEAGWRGTQSRGPATSSGGGAGLGLAIVMAVAELFGGSVSVHNTGTGCQFTLSLSGRDEERVERPRRDG
ncbi:MAG: HAMP domain-containing sensor histidine kinase [Propionibacteriaceae bacterium]|nr:HAMP domain-containing sensor histidine kinase [Propionibacteriaceae bacterium]